MPDSSMIRRPKKAERTRSAARYDVEDRRARTFVLSRMTPSLADGAPVLPRGMTTNKLVSPGSFDIGIGIDKESFLIECDVFKLVKRLD